MSAQSVRLNTVASNMANAQTLAGSAAEAYKAKYPVFMAKATKTLREQGSNVDGRGHLNLGGGIDAQSAGYGVLVTDIVESNAAPEKRYMPDNPLSDEDGYVYASNVNVVEEMADMISASRSFQMNAEIANTAKSMMQRLLTLGQ